MERVKERKRGAIEALVCQLQVVAPCRDNQALGGVTFWPLSVIVHQRQIDAVQ